MFFGLGRLPPFWRNKRPVLFPHRPLLDPSLDQVNFVFAQLVDGPNRRHAHRGIGCRNPADDYALFQIAGNDGEVAAQVLLGRALRIEA